MPRVTRYEDLHMYAGKPRLVLETWRFVRPDHTDETKKFWVVQGETLANLKAKYGESLDDLRHEFATSLEPAPAHYVLIIEEAL